MSLSAFVDHVAAAVGLEVAKNVFEGDMPPNLRRGLLFRPAGGQVEHELPGHRKTEFQVVARGETYPDSRDLADNVFNALTIRHKTIGDIWVHTCDPQHEPMFLGRDTSGVYTFVVNFEATWHTLS